MLVLSRKPGQSIDIDLDIKITVLAVNGDKVRLGIEAPAIRTVHRSEVTARILATKEQF